MAGVKRCPCKSHDLIFNLCNHLSLHRSIDTTNTSFKKELDVIISSDPLTKLTPPQMELLWNFRQYCSTVPEALPKLLRCVDWGDLEKVTEVHRLLMVWMPITLEVALELLDYHFADEKVRTLAVKRVEKLSNDELQGFLLQLVQVSHRIPPSLSNMENFKYLMCRS